MQKLTQNGSETNIKPKIIKLIVENIVENCLVLNKDFLDTQNTWSTKEQMGKLVFIKVKHFCTLKDTERMKR
jgi:hypothetical protein